MATTQEFYRIGGRLPRYTTKLSSFANGMYLTNQTIPEGYAKVMVNFDIDDTGTSIRPRPGRSLIEYQTDENLKEKEAIHLIDNLYLYDRDGVEVVDNKEVMLSFGKYQDGYYLNNITEDRKISESITQNLSHSYGHSCYYDVDVMAFGKIKLPENLGYIPARKVTDVWAFNKRVDDITRPIYTVINNELLTFIGDPVHYYTDLTTNKVTVPTFTKPILSKLKYKKATGWNTFVIEPIELRQINPIEAQNTGFNIMLDDPYTLVDEEGGSLSILGILKYYNQTRKIKFGTRLGEPVDLRVYYQYPTVGESLQYKIEKLDLIDKDSDWVTLVEFAITFETYIDENGEVQTKRIENNDNSHTAGAPFWYTYTPDLSRTLIRVTLRVGEDTATEYSFIYELNTDSYNYESLEGKTYDLSKCKGMFTWLGCVGIYGLKDASDTLFFSAVDDPGYFPYPNNLMVFDNEVLAVHNYLDNLIVVTVDSIWLVTAGTTINMSTQKKIMANVHLSEIDAINLVVLKDEIFFKAGNDFYVLKPNKYTSDATDLKNYINSTAISRFSLNFEEELTSILNKLYVNKIKAEITHFDFGDVYSIVKDNEVHYIYYVQPKLKNDSNTIISYGYLAVHLIYNTIVRSWRLYVKKVGTYGQTPYLYKIKELNAYCEFLKTYRNTDNPGFIITQEDTSTVSDLVEGLITPHQEFDNYQYLDTGTLALDDVNTKRFREVQLNLLNLENNTIRFYADFLLDGQERVSTTRYETQHITDRDDPDFGQIYVTPIEATNVDLMGISTLAEDITEADYWALDLSRFPDLSVVTVRLQLQGRGRRGQLQLLNDSLKKYELSDINWVYRTMSAR